MTRSATIQDRIDKAKDRIKAYKPPDSYLPRDSGRYWMLAYLYALIDGHPVMTSINLAAGATIDRVKRMRVLCDAFKSLERECKDVGAAALAMDMQSSRRDKTAVRGGTISMRKKPQGATLVPGWEDGVCHLCESSLCRLPVLHDRIRASYAAQRR